MGPLKASYNYLLFLAPAPMLLPVKKILVFPKTPTPKLPVPRQCSKLQMFVLNGLQMSLRPACSWHSHGACVHMLVVTRAQTRAAGLRVGILMVC